jgi:hypothetical protein
MARMIPSTLLTVLFACLLYVSARNFISDLQVGAPGGVSAIYLFFVNVFCLIISIAWTAAAVLFWVAAAKEGTSSPRAGDLQH